MKAIEKLVQVLAELIIYTYVYIYTYVHPSFYVITKNLKWEILIKNLVTFKRWDVVKYENF